MALTDSILQPSTFLKNLLELQIVLFNRTAEYGGSKSDNEIKSSNATGPTSAVLDGDDARDLIFEKGDIINGKFEILEFLGEGGFAKVVKVKDISTGGYMALKIIKNDPQSLQSAQLDIRVLEKLHELDPPGEFRCVKMFEWFEFRGHIVIAFEVLGSSLLGLMEFNNYDTYSIEQIRHISYQICHSVGFLHQNQLTHTDLKPENILFVNSQMTSFKELGQRNSEVRVIDFGMATFDNEPHSSLISTRHYRAPEVILELGWENSCDVWSIGCMIFELYLGVTLFDTDDDREHLFMMELTLGKIPSWMSKRSQKGYFDRGILKWDEISSDSRYIRDNFLPLHRFMKSNNKETRQMFDLISQMLELDPFRRMTLANALHHPFFDQICVHHCK